MPLEWLFGRKKSPQEMLRQNQRALNKAMRDLDRERSRMEGQEKKIIADIKKMAKQGQMVNIFSYGKDFLNLADLLIKTILFIVSFEMFENKFLFSYYDIIPSLSTELYCFNRSAYLISLHGKYSYNFCNLFRKKSMSMFC